MNTKITVEVKKNDWLHDQGGLDPEKNLCRELADGEICLELAPVVGGDKPFGIIEELFQMEKSSEKRVPSRVIATLLKNQDMIPEDWRNVGIIYFSGTIMNNYLGSLHMYCIEYENGKWALGYAQPFSALIHKDWRVCHEA